MKKILITITTVTCLAAFEFADYNKTFKKLYALEGTWKMNTKRGAVCEEWKKMDKNYLQNKGYMIKGNDTIINERVALTNTKEGIFYTSTVEDQNNKQHYFPKRIVYILISADSLHAYIDDGTANGKKQNFYYKRQ
jgi:hypothetical protein